MKTKIPVGSLGNIGRNMAGRVYLIPSIYSQIQLFFIQEYHMITIEFVWLIWGFGVSFQWKNKNQLPIPDSSDLIELFNVDAYSKNN